MIDLKQHAIKAHEDGCKARKTIQDEEYYDRQMKDKRIVWHDIGHELKSLMTFEEFCNQVEVQAGITPEHLKKNHRFFEIKFPDANKVRLLIKHSFGIPRTVLIDPRGKYQTQTYFKDLNRFYFDLVFPTFLEALGRAYMEAAKVNKK